MKIQHNTWSCIDILPSLTTFSKESFQFRPVLVSTPCSVNTLITSLLTIRLDLNFENLPWGKQVKDCLTLTEIYCCVNKCFVKKIVNDDAILSSRLIWDIFDGTPIVIGFNPSILFWWFCITGSNILRIHPIASMTQSNRPLKWSNGLFERTHAYVLIVVCTNDTLYCRLSGCTN